MVLNETEESWIGAKPLDHGHQKLCLGIGCFSDQSEGTVGCSLRIMYVRSGTTVIFTDIVWRENVQRKMFVPVLHYLQGVTREGSDGGQ